MGKKVFVSYKYADTDVEALPGSSIWVPTKVRNYVDMLENYFDSSDHIYKGESDNEDLSHLSDDQIWEKLKDRIYDSSITIVMISPGMKTYLPEREQWIPWEISYSLKEMTRSDRTSHSNAVLAVVLPDRNGSYDYYLTKSFCGSTTHHTERLFKIIRENKFNIKSPDLRQCPQCGGTHYYGEYSYIEAVKWNDFINSPNYYLNLAVKRQENISLYNIVKEV